MRYDIYIYIYIYVIRRLKVNGAEWPSKEQWWNFTDNRKPRVGAN